MKIRQGFISNSSTSSFIVFGVAIKNWDIDQLAIKAKFEYTYEYLEHLDGIHGLYYLSDGDGGGAPDGTHVIGYQLAKVEDYILEDKIYPLSGLINLSKKLIRQLKDLGFKLDKDQTAQLFIGTRCC